MRMQKAINHRLGYVKDLSISVDNGLMNINTYSGTNFVKGPSYMTVDMSIIVPEENFQYFDYRSLTFPLSGPTVVEEFRCLYCGRINHVSRADCESCGACRSFVMG